MDDAMESRQQGHGRRHKRRRASTTAPEIHATANVSVARLISVAVTVSGKGDQAARPIIGIVTMTAALMPSALCLMTCLMSGAGTALTLASCAGSGAATVAWWLTSRRRRREDDHDTHRRHLTARPARSERVTRKPIQRPPGPSGRAVTPPDTRPRT